MSSTGRHERTVDLTTGVVLYSFGYDESNRLISIIDQFVNKTTIERDANGTATSITSPDGIRTALTLDSTNHLTHITYADGADYGFDYTADGLLTAKREPSGNLFQHYFDSEGRLTSAADQEGGSWSYSREVQSNGDILTESLTAEGNLTTYLDHTDSSGAYTSTITDPTGAQTLFSKSADGLSASKSLPCGMNLSFTYDLDSQYKYRDVKFL